MTRIPPKENASHLMIQKQSKLQQAEAYKFSYITKKQNLKKHKAGVMEANQMTNIKVEHKLTLT